MARSLIVVLIILSGYLSYGQISANLDRSESEKSSGKDLTEYYHHTQCGLNYVQASVLLGKKMAAYGMPFYGIDQPATVSVNGIPAGAVIEDAFIWWDQTGPGTSGNVILQNPIGVTDTFPGQLIAHQIVDCWSMGGSAFRANVTSVISGNGDYLLSGLPIDTSFTQDDANGATLFIIYSDKSANFSGTLLISEGFLKCKQDTLARAITNINSGSTSTIAKSFMLLSDLSNEGGTALKMNNGSFQGVTENCWDFEEKSTAVLNTQTTSSFAVRIPNDCANWILMGLYYQLPHSTISPLVARNGDTLTSSQAYNYQWYHNSLPITGANNQAYIAYKAGIYFVETYDTIGCASTSDTTEITCINSFKPSIFSTEAALWTEDTFMISYQWFFNGSIIQGAESKTYDAIESGYYHIQVTDSLGCISISDSIQVTIGFAIYDSFNYKLSVSPNPSTGVVVFTTNYPSLNECRLQLINTQGQVVKLISDLTPTTTLRVEELSPGIYFLSFSNTKFSVHRKIIITP